MQPMEGANSPTIYLFGGSNGAGKTTFDRAFLPSVLPGGRFLNADEIARGLSPFAVEAVAFKAGRLLLAEVEECIAARKSFGLESTPSGKTYVRMLQKARAEGYRVELHYVWLRSAALAVKRVRLRVRHGGHFVPEQDVRRRYARSIELLLSDYMPLADSWSIWDNRSQPPKLLAASPLHDICFAEKLLRER